MKKLAILSMVFIFAMSAAQGQTQKAEKQKVTETKKERKTERVALRKLEGKEVSEQAKSAFNVDFKGATKVLSKRVDTFDEFSFTSKDGKQMKAFYDYDSQLVGTTQIIAFSDLPLSGQQEIKKQYKDYTIGPVIFFDDNEANETDMILYSTQFDDADNYFVELSKGKDKLIVQINSEGELFFFKQL